MLGQAKSPANTEYIVRPTPRGRQGRPAAPFRPPGGLGRSEKRLRPTLSSP